MQEPALDERFPAISRAHYRDELHLIDERERIFTGATAVREILARLPGASLRTIPFHVPGGMWVANQAYRWVARNRGWLSNWLESTTDDRPPGIGS